MHKDPVGDLYVYWIGYRELNRSLRPGQALMNCLHRWYPALYEGISNTASDCFYRDERIPLTWVDVIGHLELPDRTD